MKNTRINEALTKLEKAEISEKGLKFLNTVIEVSAEISKEIAALGIKKPLNRRK